MHPVLAANAPLAYDPDSLERYYVAVGVPAGHFLGRGLAGLNDGAGVTEEAPVEDEHLRRMLHECADPITGKQLAAKKVRANAVAGFDLTFSPSKSVSVAWALGERATRDIIYRCHQEAIKYVLDYAEREVFRVRTGTDGVVSDETNGPVAVAFSHFDSLDGDPQLHDHVVVLNRAQSARDGGWRTLDSRAVFAATVELSELHQGVLSDLLAQELGWDFDARTRRHSDAPKWEVTGISDNLIAHFSQRSVNIAIVQDRLIEKFQGRTQRAPSTVEMIQLRQTAALVAARPAKWRGSLAALSAEWTARATHQLGTSPAALVDGLAVSPVITLSDAVGPDEIDLLGRVSLAAVSTKRVTFTLSNLRAEANRQLQGWHFVTPTARESVIRAVAAGATTRAILLTPDLPPRGGGSARFTSIAHRDAGVTWLGPRPGALT